MKLSRNVLHWRDLMLELISRDLKVRYQRSAIGLAWSLMKPLAQLAIFATVFSSILPLNIKNYTTFTFTGVLVWAWFSSSLTYASVSIVGSREMVRRPGFPVRLLPALAILSQGVHFLLALPLLFVSSWIQIGPPALCTLALPLLIMAQFLFMLAVTNLLATAQVFFRDVEHFVGIVMMLGFYVTPVFYRPLDANQAYWFLTAYNPVAWLLEGYRAIFVDHTWPGLWIYFQLILVSVPMLALGHWYFDKVSSRFVDEL
jgi:lipopolysaccharide transport system permease protein